MIPRLACALVLVGSGASAQVIVNGIVQPVPGPTICMQGETHLLECTSVFLRSSTIDLNNFVGQTVRVTGVDVGLLCTVIEVTSAVPAGVTLDFNGAPTPGGTVAFTVCVFTSNPPHVYALFVSPSSGYLPLDPILGTALLGPPVVLFGAGFTFGCSNVPVSIPPDPSLVGASFWIQAFGSGTFVTQLSNAVCLTII
ncbi:MAG TPA: hypothetical protein VFI25_06450 [Planctomycetota bacterium]|jgi:hypothetical protein|nr:hypothetical protein [Planctomycetota bacterium]